MTQPQQKLAVIGWPVEHSLSPAIHRYWLDQLGIDATYEAVAVAPDDLAAFVGAAAKNGYRGLNVTLPHKEAVMGLADQVTPVARQIGAVNAVTVGEDGKITVDNTDARGFMNALSDFAPLWRPDNGPVLVLGAGGAARAICFALLDAGVGDLRIANRTGRRAESLSADLVNQFEAGCVQVLRWQDRGNTNRAFGDDPALIVNATSIGLGSDPGDGEAGPISLGALSAATIVFDTVYGPRDTPLVRQAKGAGMMAADGLGMLLHQAALSFQGWFGVLPAIDEGVRQAISFEIESRANNPEGGPCLSSG